MRILIDFSQIPKDKTGVGMYGLGIIHSLMELDSTNEYYIIIQDDDKDFDRVNSRNLHKIKINHRLFRQLPIRFIFEQIGIPLLALRHKISVLHSLHYSFPLFAGFCKKVVTVHDLTFFKMPHVHRRIKTIYFRFFINILKYFVKNIIVISESTKNDLIELTGIRKERVHVLALGAPDWSGENFTEEALQRVKDKYQLGRKEYLLFIGMIEPRKNIMRIMKAYDRLEHFHDRYDLVIAGKNGWHTESLFVLLKKLRSREHIHFTGYVDEQDKPYLIKGATLFLYPSLYEGFGIPLLESMALGVPTITSNISSMPEITGNAALKIDPENVEDLMQAVDRLIGDAKIREQLSKRSRHRVEKFTWDIHTKQSVKIYQTAL